MACSSRYTWYAIFLFYEIPRQLDFDQNRKLEFQLFPILTPVHSKFSIKNNR